MHPSTPTAVQGRVKVEWLPWRSEYLVKLLIDQKMLGKKSDNGFKKEAWRSVLLNFNNKFDLQFTIQNLKNHYAHLKKQYNIVKALRDQNGFGWDEARQMVTASDDLWQHYLLAHPGAKTYRTKGIPLYDELDTLFTGTIANGTDQFSSIYIDPPEDDQPKMENIHTPNTVSLSTPDKLLGESEASLDNEIRIASSQHKKCRSTTPTISPCERRVQVETRQQLAGNMHEMVANSVVRQDQDSENEKLLKKCVIEMQEMVESGSLDPEEFVTAVDLMRDKYFKIVFLQLKGELRLFWLKSKCRKE